MWKTFKLEDIFKICSSKRVLKSEWRKSGIPFYRGREITSLSKYDFVENDLFISEEHFFKLSEKYGVPAAGDILITAIGTIGNTYITKEEDKFYFKDASVLWLNKIKDVSSEFINYWFRSDLFKKQNEIGNGATVDSLSISKLKSMEISIPTLSEQQQIVAKLDAAFAEIEISLAKLAKIENNISDFFEKILDEISNVSAPFVSLKDVCEIKAKLVDPKEAPYCNQFHVGAGNMTSLSNELENVLTAKEENLISSKFPFNTDSVLYSKIRPYLRKVHLPSYEGICSADIYPLIPIKHKLNREYLYYLLLSKHFTNYAMSGSARSGMPKVNRNHLFDYHFPLPSIKEQKAFVERIKIANFSTFILKNNYAKKINEFKKLKSAILSRELKNKVS